MAAGSKQSGTSVASPSGRNVAFLEDRPTTGDWFGGHKALAEALARIIRTSDVGLTIGLRGRWGSGKSTVIELLRVLCERKNSSDSARTPPGHGVRLFVYDCWTDERGPWRRVFLERLGDSLLQCEWLDWCEKQWKKQKDRLAGRWKSTETFQRAKLTWFGAFVILSFFVTQVWGTRGSWALVGAVILLWLAGLVCEWFFGKWSAQETWRHRLSSLISMLDGKRGETYVTETVTTPEPTASEFQDAFCELMRRSLQPDEGRRLVLVVDNLDRVDPRTAAALWSTLHSVVSSGDPRAGWRSRLFTIVPFDDTAIKRIWCSDGQHAGGDQSRTTEHREDLNAVGEEAEVSTDAELDGSHRCAGDARPRDAKTLAEAFAEKTFQIIVDVPPPALAKYREFMGECVCKAMPRLKSNTDQVAGIYNVFRKLRCEASQAPTPREIKRYVNDVAALWLTRDAIGDRDAIPLATIGAFALLRDTLIDPHADLPEGSPWRKRHEQLIRRWTADERWVEHFAALALGIEVKQAVHILVYQRMVTSLEDGDHDTLRRLLALDGAEAVMCEVLAEHTREWAGRGADVLGKAAAAMEAAKYEGDEGWRHVFAAVETVVEPEDPDEVCGRGLAAIIRQAAERSKEQAELITKQLARAVAAAAPGRPS